MQIPLLNHQFAGQPKALVRLGQGSGVGSVFTILPGAIVSDAVTSIVATVRDTLRSAAQAIDVRATATDDEAGHIVVSMD